MKWALMAVAALGLTVVVSAARAEEKKDAKKLDGTWTVTSIEHGGEKVPADDVKDSTVTFAGDNVTYHDGKSGKDKKGTVKIDTSKKPWTIDITPSEGQAMKGIYTLDGDTLKIALSEDARPTAFTSEKGSKAGVMTLTRKK
jgi:uncharacterized protein (TIGR03067 family)